MSAPQAGRRASATVSTSALELACRSASPYFVQRSQRVDHVLDREAGRVRVGQHAGDEGAQPAIVLARRVGLCRRGADERADAAARLDDAGALELRVDARDGVGVDPQLHRQLADGRQLVARLQPARGDGRAQAAFELRVNRRRVPGVNGDDAHLKCLY